MKIVKIINTERGEYDSTENYSIKKAITKVRRLVKIFKVSSLNNGILQKDVKKTMGKELSLILYIRT